LFRLSSLPGMTQQYQRVTATITLMQTRVLTCLLSRSRGGPFLSEPLRWPPLPLLLRLLLLPPPLSLPLPCLLPLLCLPLLLLW